MSTLYWLTVLGNISLIAAIAAGLFLFGCVMLLVKKIIDDDLSKLNEKGIKISLIGLFASLVLCVLIPPKTELYAIYGVGSVIDYAKNSKEVQKLPDNAVKALNVYLENIQKQDSTDSK